MVEFRNRGFRSKYGFAVEASDAATVVGVGVRRSEEREDGRGDKAWYKIRGDENEFDLIGSSDVGFTSGSMAVGDCVN